MLAWSSQSLGIVKLNLGELEAAEEYLSNGMQAWKRIKNRWIQCINLRWIAYIYQLRGLYERADDLLEQSTQMGKTTGMARVQIWGMVAKAGLNFDRGDLLQARNNLEQLKPLVKNNQVNKIKYLFISGRLEHVQVKHQKALEHLKTACDLVKSSSGSYGWPAVYCLLAVVLHELGEQRAAFENFKQALGILSKEYEHPELVETLEWLAIFCADHEQWQAATRFIAAIDALRQISGIVPPVPYQQRWGATRERVKENLSEGDFTKAWDEANAIEQLSLPDYALEQLVKLKSDEQLKTHARS